MADELRPYILGRPSSSSLAADADTSGGRGVEEGRSSDSSGTEGPLLTISDINPDMLEVNKPMRITRDWVLCHLLLLLVQPFDSVAGQ